MFECRCERCLDTTELGTHLGSDKLFQRSQISTDFVAEQFCVPHAHQKFSQLITAWIVLCGNVRNVGWKCHLML